MVMKLLFLLLFLLTYPVCQAEEIQTPFVPPQGKILLLVGQDRDTIAHYVSGIRLIPAGTMAYTSLENIEGLESSSDYGSGPEDLNALVKRYPDSVIQIGLYLVGELEGVLDGSYDDHLKVLSRCLKNTQRPVYLRIGYEFDNPDNHYDPESYKKAFRYIVDHLRKDGVHNVAYVWHSTCSVLKPGQNWMDWYPGDLYVDWFGASMFAMPDQLWTAPGFVKLARDHKKPFMICESSPWGMYSMRAKTEWFRHIFQFIKEQQVQAFCYINSNWDAMPMYKGQGIGDQRVEAYSSIKKLWLIEITQDRYLKASKDLFKLLK